MGANLYQKKFQNAADQIDKTSLARKQLEIAVGLYKDSVFLKVYKKSWVSFLQDPLTAKTRIFFSLDKRPGNKGIEVIM